MRRQIPMAITIGVGWIILLNNLIKFEVPGVFNLAVLASTLTSWGSIIGAVAALVATVNLIMVHSQRVSRKRDDSLNSGVLLVCMLVTGSLGVFGQIFTGQPFPMFTDIFNNIISPAGQAMFAMVGFYISSAAYRAFRVRSAEATVLLVAAILLMLGRAPIGELIWQQFPPLANWLMSIPNAAAQRGIMLCAAIGAVASSIRILLGLDRGYLGSGE